MGGKLQKHKLGIITKNREIPSKAKNVRIWSFKYSRVSIKYVNYCCPYRPLIIICTYSKELYIWTSTQFELMSFRERRPWGVETAMTVGETARFLVGEYEEKGWIQWLECIFNETIAMSQTKWQWEDAVNRRERGWYVRRACPWMFRPVPGKYY